MKLLMFHPALAPYRVDFFNELNRHFDVELALMDDNLRDQRFDQSALLSRLKCRVSRLRNGIRICSRYVRLGVLSCVRRARPDVVVSYECSPTTLFLVLLRLFRILRRPLWTMTDDNERMIASGRGLHAFCLRIVLRHVDGVVVTNDAVAAQLRHLAGRPSLCTAVVPIVHDEKTFRANEAELFARGMDWRSAHLRSDEKMLLYVGRFAAVKNLPMLLDAVAELIGKQPFKLVLVGGGTEAERRGLQGRVCELGIERNVVFAGRFEGDELKRFFAVADLFVLPSRFEPYGVVVGEALQWGVPCAVSEAVGAGVLIENASQGAVFSLTVPDMAEKIGRLLDDAPSVHLRPSLIGNRLSEAVDAFAHMLNGEGASGR